MKLSDFGLCKAVDGTQMPDVLLPENGDNPFHAGGAEAEEGAPVPAANPLGQVRNIMHIMHHVVNTLHHASCVVHCINPPQKDPLTLAGLAAGLD
jgi:hypothetical protein